MENAWVQDYHRKKKDPEDRKQLETRRQMRESSESFYLNCAQDGSAE